MTSTTAQTIGHRTAWLNTLNNEDFYNEIARVYRGANRLRMDAGHCERQANNYAATESWSMAEWYVKRHGIKLMAATRLEIWARHRVLIRTQYQNK